MLLGPPAGADRLALSGGPVDQACGIQQRASLIEEVLDVESDFKALVMKAGTGAGIGCASYSCSFIKPSGHGGMSDLGP